MRFRIVAVCEWQQQLNAVLGGLIASGDGTTAS